jgi:signal transduction histidine kinase
MEISSHTITYNGKKAVLTLGNNVTEKVLLENSLMEERKIRQQQITDAVITGQEKERVEIGQELHDNINQILATTKLYLEYALVQKKFRHKLINESKILTEKAMMEIRKLSNSLLPPSLEEVGLLEALNDLVENIKTVNSIKIITNWEEFTEYALDKKLKLTIFRIVQEQLNNIIKHAHATRAKISIVQKNDQVWLRIEDDGIGFDTSRRKNGVGIKNIISRSEVNNGKVSIQSKPGEGCVIAVCFTSTDIQ